jgi:hypothetical protein
VHLGYSPQQRHSQEDAKLKELPDDFAIALGQVLYVGGLVEMLLDRCLAPADSEPLRRGLSGAPLVKELRKIATPGTRLDEITSGYEAMHEWRNHLVHGVHDYANGIIWTWREPSRAKGRAAFSFQFTLESLRQTAQSWLNLAQAIEELLEERADNGAGGSSEKTSPVV